jgi:hypothetical protein
MGEPVDKAYRSFARHRRTLMLPAPQHPHAVRTVLVTRLSAKAPHRRRFVMGRTDRYANQAGIVLTGPPVAV